MIGFLFRLLWRIIIFTLGFYLAWLTLTKVYPYINEKLPAFIALLLLYCGFVYGIVPLLIRLFRIFIKPDHIPLYVTTGDGWPSDPVNIALIVKNRTQLEEAMMSAGWHAAHPLTFKNGLRELAAFIFNLPYPEAPLSNLYLFNRPHDIGFELSTNARKSPRTRHHVRFWRLEEPPVHSDQKHLYAFSFWSQKLRHLLVGKKEMWIGAATEETQPLDIQWHTGQFTHGGSHEADRERDFIIHSLEKIGSVAEIHTSEPGEKLRFRGQQVRTFYVTDGSIKIVKLK
jgi:hypothetical protein